MLCVCGRSQWEAMFGRWQVSERDQWPPFLELDKAVRAAAATQPAAATSTTSSSSGQKRKSFGLMGTISPLMAVGEKPGSAGGGSGSKKPRKSPG